MKIGIATLMVIAGITVSANGQPLAPAGSQQPSQNSSPAQNNSNQTGTQQKPAGNPPDMLNRNYQLPPGYATNPLVLNTNQFGTNPFVAATNPFASNQFGFLSNGQFVPLTPTTRSNAGSRFYLTNGFNPTTPDTAFLPSDQQILLQLHRSVGAQLAPVLQPGGILPIHFFVREGVVTIVGYVPTPADQQRVAQIVQQTPGVVRVADELQVTEPGATGAGGVSAQPMGATNRIVNTNFH